MFIYRSFVCSVLFFMVMGLFQPLRAHSNVAPIKVAFLLPMTGPVPLFGAEGLKGAQFEVGKWNAGGGVLGRNIEIVQFDSKCNATEAAARANEVVAQGIHYIIGEICSSASIAVSAIAEANGILQISPSSTELGVTVDSGTGNTKNYVFRACFIDSYQGEMMARFAMQQGLDKIFLLVSSDTNSKYSSGLYNSFKSTFSSLGGQIAGDTTYDPGASDYSGLISQIQATNPDAVYLPDYYNIVNKITSQAKLNSLLIPFLGGDGWDSTSLNLSATDGAFFTNHFSLQDTRPEVQQYVTDFKAANGGADPTTIAALTSDSVNILLSAIQQAGVDDPAVVKDYLMKSSFQTVTGKVVFNPQHNPTKNLVVNHISSSAINFFRSYLPNGSISGKVLNAASTPISDATIHIKAAGTSIGADTQEVLVSSVDGSYSIQGLFPGNYQLVANSKNSAGYTVVYYLNQLNSDLAASVNVITNQNTPLLDMHLSVPIVVTIQPSAPGVINHNQVNGVNTQVAVPAGGVSDVTELHFSPLSADTQGGFVFAGTAFNLDAYQGGVAKPNLVFQQPVSIIIQYTDASIGTLREEFLKLDYWNSTTHLWEDALCPGQSYGRDLVNNILTVPICHLSSYSLFVHNFKSHLPEIANP